MSNTHSHCACVCIATNVNGSTHLNLQRAWHACVYVCVNAWKRKGGNRRGNSWCYIWLLRKERKEPECFDGVERFFWWNQTEFIFQKENSIKTRIFWYEPRSFCWNNKFRISIFVSFSWQKKTKKRQMWAKRRRIVCIKSLFIQWFKQLRKCTVYCVPKGLSKHTLF